MSGGLDRELTLAELLPGGEWARLTSALGLLLEVPLAIVDAAGDYLAGTQGVTAEDAVPLTLEIEPLGYLRAPAAKPVARAAAAALVGQVLRARARYLMAASVHRATTEADYAELQRQNAALATSESKYRALSEALEQRVAEQVQVIDARQRQLYQAERLASVGQLAAGVAHEINNPIGFVRSNLNTARTYGTKIAALGGRVAALPGGQALWAETDMDFLCEDLAELVEDSIGGIDRVARIVADLKGFSNVDKPEEEVVNLNDVVAGACALVEPQLLAGARLVRRLGALVPQMCLPGHLAQALLAVLTNALQAIAGKGPDGVVIVETLATDAATVIRIQDNGTGIAPEHLPRVFDPFFTTRPVGQGTGLGLTVARDIVRTHGGDIVIDQPAEGGTVVTLTLPE